jgi:hypothetical protein
MERSSHMSRRVRRVLAGGALGIAAALALAGVYTEKHHVPGQP